SASQAIEFTPFRLTHPFPLAYTRLTASCGFEGRLAGSRRANRLQPSIGVTVNEYSMSFISRVMRFLFWLLVLSWSVALLRGVVRWMLRGSGTGQRGPDVTSSSDAVGMARRLVRDPVCGAHVAE